MVSLFTSVATQWRMGFAGPVGLDYTPMLHLMDRMGLPAGEYDNLFHDMRIAESEALSVMNNRDK